MPRFRLAWLEIADRQYHELPDAIRVLIDRRLAQLVENPTVDPDADYNERCGSVERAGGRRCVAVLRRRTGAADGDRAATGQLRVAGTDGDEGPRRRAGQPSAA